MSELLSSNALARLQTGGHVWCSWDVCCREWFVFIQDSEGTQKKKCVILSLPDRCRVHCDGWVMRWSESDFLALSLEFIFPGHDVVCTRVNYIVYRRTWEASKPSLEAHRYSSPLFQGAFHIWHVVTSSRNRCTRQRSLFCRGLVMSIHPMIYVLCCWLFDWARVTQWRGVACWRSLHL